MERAALLWSAAGGALPRYATDVIVLNHV